MRARRISRPRTGAGPSLGRATAAALLLAGIALTSGGCGTRHRERAPLPAGSPPNILLIVWDTVRADHLSLYGYAKATTPHLDEWARGARVYDDCISPAPYTVPSHASLFTGLLPTEHGASNDHPALDTPAPALAELLRQHGYQTYLFSANPHISREEGFQRGFEVEEHPWDPAYRSDAFRIVAAKIVPDDESSELAAKIRAGKPRGGWDVKASGALARRGTEAWLERRDPRRPFFVFLNYMEAHRPWIPPAAERRRVMSAQQVALSYRIDRSWIPLWSYTFGLGEYTPAQLEVMAATYDACIAELDGLVSDLLGSLREKGLLDDTVVVLTADHGEHLGEHHILDHQYSLYEPVLHVPLVILDPRHFPPGRERRPVMTQDLFPTLLRIAGIEPPRRDHAVSLLEPSSDRVRISEYLGPFRDAFPAVEPLHPGWDRSPWQREIRAIYRGPDKLIRWSDGRRELYAPGTDPGERRDLASGRAVEAGALEGALETAIASATAAPGATAPVPISDEQRERLRALGYVHGSAAGAPNGAQRPETKPR